MKEINIDGLNLTLRLVLVQLKTINKIYALHICHEQKGSSDVANGMLKVFHLDVYDLMYLDATLSFLTPYMAMRFDIFLNMLLDPFFISTLIDESIVSKRVDKKCPISSSRRVLHVVLVDLYMLDFDVILGRY